MFFESFKAKEALLRRPRTGVPSPLTCLVAMPPCEALFKLNRSFLSLPIDAINGVALSVMNDHYNNIVALRESTPERMRKHLSQTAGEAAPRPHRDQGESSGSARRDQSRKETAAAVEKDVLRWRAPRSCR